MEDEKAETVTEEIMGALPEEIQESPQFPWLLLLFGFGLASSSLWIFSEIADEILESDIIVFDTFIISYLQSFNDFQINQFMHLTTETGSFTWITIFSIITVFWLWHYKKDNLSILFFIITVAGGGLLNYILKLFFQRARPALDPTIDAVGFSFPSGHSMGSMIFYGFIGYLIIRSNRSKSTKIIISIILLIFILLIGISRIYLNAHFPSDVLAGFSAGLLWLTLSITALRVVKGQKKQKKPEVSN